MIIIVHWLLKVVNKRVVVSSLIISLFFAGFITIRPNALADNISAIMQRTSIERYYQDTTYYNCQEFGHTQNRFDSTVILRLDDVQSFYLSDLTQQIISDTSEKNMKIVASVIPHEIDKDVEMINFLQREICSVEIAQHGYDHSLLEFSELDYESADERIHKGKELLTSVFPSPITTFIPPYNVYSEATGRSIRDNGFMNISSKGDWRFDQVTSVSGADGALRNMSEIFMGCEEKFEQSEPCVIMVHPQDYATNDVLDEVKYQNYTDLLNYIESNDIQTTTIQSY